MQVPNVGYWSEGRGGIPHRSAHYDPAVIYSTHSFKTSIDPSVNRFLCFLYFLLTQVLWRAVWLMRWWMYSGESPLFCPSFILADEKSFLTTDFTGFSQNNDKRLSFPIMLNAVLQMAVKGRDVSFIRLTVYVSAFPPQAFFHYRRFQIYY